MTTQIQIDRPKPKHQKPTDSPSAADAWAATTAQLGTSMGFIAKMRPDIAALLIVLMGLRPSSGSSSPAKRAKRRGR